MACGPVAAITVKSFVVGKATEVLRRTHVGVEAVAFTDSYGLDGDSTHFVGGQAVHEPVTGLLVVVDIEVELAAVAEVTGRDQLLQLLAGQIASGDLDKERQGPFHERARWQREKITLEAGGLGELQSHESEGVEVDAELGSRLRKGSSSTGRSTLAHNLCDLKILDQRQ